MPLGEALLGVSRRLPLSAIPEDNGAAAIFALGARPFKIAIFQRVFLDVDGQPLFAGHQAWSTRHRPAPHHPVQPKPQLLIPTARALLLSRIVVHSASGCRDPQW